jgi:hypothetical protein
MGCSHKEVRISFSLVSDFSGVLEQFARGNVGVRFSEFGPTRKGKLLTVRIVRTEKRCQCQNIARTFHGGAVDILLELFAKQVSTIVERKFHIPTGLSESDFINRHIMPLKQLLVEDDKDTKLEENHIPILIVVPNTIVPLSYQLERIRESINDIQLGHIIKPEWFENAKGLSTPDKPYLLIDVETGYAMKNTTPKKCVKTFKDEARFALTVDEGIALIAHFPEVLESHWVDLPGSVLIHKFVGEDVMKRGMLSSLPPAFAKATFVPTLNYKYYNYLRLYYIYEVTETPYSGSASCAKRLSL